MPGAEGLVVEAFRNGAGFAIAIVLLILWDRANKAREGDRDRRENKLVEMAERSATAAERQAVTCEETSDRVVEIVTAYAEGQREHQRQFITLLQAIKDGTPRRGGG